MGAVANNIKLVPGEGAETDHDDIALRAATMYYVQDLTMAVIARQLDVSPSTVSRLVKHARERGLVEIRVASILGHPRMSKMLLDRYNVRAKILTGPPEAPEQLAQRVGRAAARQHATWLVPDIVVAVDASGPLMSAVGESLMASTRGMVVTAMTGMDAAGQSALVLESVRQRLGVEVVHVPAPQFVPDEASVSMLSRLPDVASALDLAANAHLAIMEVHSGHVAGLTMPGRSRGRQVRHAIGLTADQIREIEWRVIISTGTEDTDLLAWALEEGLATHALLDEAAARALLRHGDGE